MTCLITPKEFAAVSALGPTARFEHFVKRVADWEEVWGLKNAEGWVLSRTAEGREVASFWPQPEYAHACSEGNWAGSSPALISLQVFLDRWITGLEKDGRLVAIFATQTSPGIVLEPATLREAIEQEIDENYGDDD